MAAPFNVTYNGGGLELLGLAWNPTDLPDTWYVSGVGVVTFGFVWSLNDIWFDCCPIPETVWEDDSCNASCN